MMDFCDHRLYNETIVGNIRRISQDKRITNGMIARAIGVSERKIGNIFYGTNALRPLHIAKIAKYLGVSADELLKV